MSQKGVKIADDKIIRVQSGICSGYFLFYDKLK